MNVGEQKIHGDGPLPVAAGQAEESFGVTLR